MTAAVIVPEHAAKRVLTIAYYFPPLGGMGSVRAARFVRYLPELGWKPLVVTPSDGMYHRPRGGWAPPPGIEIVTTSSLELSRVFRRVHGWVRRTPLTRGETLEPVPTGRMGSALRSILRELIYVPDAQIGWLPFAVRAAERVVRDQAPAVLYTTSVPFTSHLVGRVLQRRHGIPWVAEFRDLWTGSQAGEARTRLRRTINRRLEASIVEQADAVIVTTPGARSLIEKTCPEATPDRIHVVTNSFDALDHPSPSPPEPDAPFVLVHAGTIMPRLQDPAPLLEAIGRLETRQPGSIRIRVFGPDAPWRAAAAARPLPAGVLELGGLLAPSRIPVELSRASAVLLLAPGPSFRAVYLGKMFEWLGSGVPALAVVDTTSAMAEVVRRSGGGVIAAENQPAALEQALERLLRDHRQGALRTMAPDPSAAREFEAKGVTRRLVSVFEAAVRNARERRERSGRMRGRGR